MAQEDKVRESPLTLFIIVAIVAGIALMVSLTTLLQSRGRGRLAHGGEIRLAGGLQ